MSGHAAAGPQTPAIGRLLVANRGELVPRITRTCRALGLTCVALVAEDQAGAWWTRQAHERVPLDGTYLDAEAVLRAAHLARADAVHPGYGFLAESAAFAEAVAAAGLVWVGPPPDAMRRLGDKAAGRALAATVGVPVLPGYEGTDQSDETLEREAGRIGYPVLVKPSAGGGGKGMHVVRGTAELAETLARARREAKASFGDDRLVLERYVERPRHVEVQILFDAHGTGVHLGERDCSLQRRHQKVIEESPSPAVDEGLRTRLGDAALRLAGAAGYVGAGTVEFLLDDAGGFHFLELNARLQVEHPVTELVTGRDLVSDQLRIASGERLWFAQEDVRLNGHAVEARVYAEDPWGGFLPAVGTVVDVRLPEGPGIRLDAGVGTGDTIGTRYDPMIAKVLAHAADRETALAALSRALDETRVFGVTTNRAFLRWLLEAPDMRAGDARTDFIESAWRPGDDDQLEDAFALGARALTATLAGDRGTAPGWRLNGQPMLRVRIGDDVRAVGVDGDATPEAWIGTPAPGTPAGATRTRGTPAGETAAASEAVLDLDGRAFRVSLAPAPTVEEALVHAAREASGAQAVTASMPGTVLAVRVADGEDVEAHQVLVVLEAMKMENAVTAPADGRVTRVLVSPGQTVQRGDALVELG